MKTKHPLALPPMSAINVRYLSIITNRWRVVDRVIGAIGDGLVPALAYVGQMQSFRVATKADKPATVITLHSFAWVATCNCKTHGECPASRALDKACDLWDGASLIRLPPYERKPK